MKTMNLYLSIVKRNWKKIFCAYYAVSMIVAACCATPLKIYADNQAMAAKTPVEMSCQENNHAISGMFFSTENVLEEYEYDDAYCLLYDDADADMFNVEISVDLETYQIVCQSIKNGKPLVGTLVLNEDLSYEGMEVFTYMEDPEMEMPETLAKNRVVSIDCLSIE